MERDDVTPESSKALPWTREEDGYIIGVCKEKEMQDWRNELRAALPGRTRREILKRLWYLGIMMKKVKMVSSEGDDLGGLLRVYVTRNVMTLPEGSGDEVDAAEAMAHLEAYQRVAEGITASACPPCGPGGGVPADFDFETPPLVDDGAIEGTHSGSSSQASVSMSSEGAPESDAGSEEGEAGRGFSVVAGEGWTSDEDAAIRMGVEAGRSWKEISDGIPGRTFLATKTRGLKLGLKHREAWTSDEEAAIRAGFEAGKTWREIAESLPGRTFFATRHRGEKLGMKHHERWTADEDATLRAGVEVGESWEAIAEKLPGRNGDMVMERARRLKIARSEKQLRVAWTEAEDEEVRTGVAAGETTEEIAKRLPRRTLDAVEHRRTRLLKGRRPVAERWTEGEDAALREGFASGKCWKEIAKDFPSRTQWAVKTRGLTRLKLKRRDSDSAV
jgi:hypothetical protein